MPGDNRGGKVGGISGSWVRLQVDPVDTWLVDGHWWSCAVAYHYDLESFRPKPNSALVRSRI